MPEHNQDIFDDLERKVRWLSCWMIHHANHIRPKSDGMKVGGHQASSASLAAVMTALYFGILRPWDRVAVKPHASPNFHAIQYLLGLQKREQLENFRGYKGAQSYPSRTKDIDDVDFSTGSVGLGVAQTLFSSLVQDYVRAHGWGADNPQGRMIALVGDAEMDEGNIFEALLEGWKHGLKNCWWIIDYNRQSLDSIIHEGLWSRFQSIFRDFGWEVVILKYGSLLQAAGREPGGDKLLAWIDKCPNQLYAALTFQGGAAWRKRLTEEIGDQGPVTALIDRRSDDELAVLMTNLGGHDLPTLLEAFSSVKHDRPVCFIAYTVKGYGLPLAGHKDNHAGLMTPAQMQTFQASLNIREGCEWDIFEGLRTAPSALADFLKNVPFAAQGARRHEAPYLPPPADLPIDISREMSTQQGFGQLLNELGRQETEFTNRVVTTSPDVTVSTNLGAWVNRRGLFAREELPDTFKNERVPSAFKWSSSPQGQHLELGIAESNLFIMLSALGLSHSITGNRLIPIGTVYDPFIARGLDALNYACYQDARFILAATPSGISLAHEGGAHQSIGAPLLGMSQCGLTYFEPAFIDELSTILLWSFDHIQRHAPHSPIPEPNWLCDDAGGSVYLRLSTRPLEQPNRSLTDDQKGEIVDGAYWMRRPGPNCEVVVAYTGVVAAEAIEAVGLIGEDKRDVGLLSITSVDRLHSGWISACRAREKGQVRAESHIEKLIGTVPSHCGFITVVDGHPAALSWLGSVHGHKVRALGVHEFGQTGSLAELYEHYGISTNAIVRAAEEMTGRRPIRHLMAVK